jgi:Fe-S cluster assembly scaffold protein SufB
LDVLSSNVKASHGAKIHSLDRAKMFYMVSKGLSFQKSQRMIIQSVLQSIFDKLTSFSLQEKQQYFDSIIDSIFSFSKKI